MSKQLTWTAKNGQQISVNVYGTSYSLTVNGQYKGSTGVFSPVPAQHTIKAQADGIVCFLLHVGLTAELKAALEALQAEVKLERAPFREMQRLESAVEKAEDAVRAHHENPAYAYAELEKASAALDAWKAANPELWSQEVAFRTQLAADRLGAVGEGQDY